MLLRTTNPYSFGKRVKAWTLSAALAFVQQHGCHGATNKQ